MLASGKFTLPLFFLITFLGAMILGPILYFALGYVFPVPFHRAMDRALLISALAALVVFRSSIPLRKLWPLNRNAGLQLMLGYLIAAVTAQAMIGFYLAAVGFTSAGLSASQVLGRIALALVAAIIVPFLEETLFRGFIQGELTNRLGWRVGWILGALIFLLAHFIKVPVELDHEPVHLWSGVTALGAAFSSLAQGNFLSGRGLNLFLIGLILGGIVLRSETLWLNAGLHSGWIFILLLFTGLTRSDEPARVSWLAGDLLSNPITSVVFILLGVWLWRYYRNPSIVPEIGDDAPST